MKMEKTACKKYKVQAVIDPGTLIAVEYEKDIQKQARHSLLLRDIEKFRNGNEISVGQIVAVKHEDDFCRGLITDIFSRNMKSQYHVWLVDKGNNIEVPFDSLFMIRTSELRDMKLNTYEVVVHGIQPLTVQVLVSSLNFDFDTNSEGILQKRESSEWSPAALKFVQTLFMTNKVIYVKCINVNGSRITGDVYYENEDETMLISLAQTLCDNDFAVFSNNQLEGTELYNHGFNSIERRIPDIPKAMEWDEFSIMQHSPMTHGKESSSSNISSSSGSDKSSYVGLNKYINNSEPKRCDRFSPSWILKKVNSLSESASSESFKSSCQNIEQTGSVVMKPKVNMFKVVERNIQLFDNYRKNI